VIDTIRGPLSNHGLAFVQPLTTAEDACWLETRLMHSSGEWIATAAEIPEWAASKGVNALQSFGGALTYMRRYMLTSMLGINAEEDTDGSGGNGTKPKAAAKKKPAQPPKSEPKAAHWIDGQTRNGKKVSAAFWAWTSEQGLSDAEVYIALEVEHIHDYTGTMGDAKTTINEWIARQADAQAALEVDAQEGAQ
jgi:hypothetical protein